MASLIVREREREREREKDKRLCINESKRQKEYINGGLGIFFVVLQVGFHDEGDYGGLLVFWV